MFANVQVPFQVDAEIHPALECAATRKTFGRMRCHVRIKRTDTHKLLFTRSAHVIDAIVQNFEQRFELILAVFVLFCPER